MRYARIIDEYAKLLAFRYVRDHFDASSASRRQGKRTITFRNSAASSWGRSRRRPAAFSDYALATVAAVIAALGGERVGALRQHCVSFQLVHNVDWNRDLGIA